LGGDCVGFTPYGPRGPATVASAGVVNVARLAGMPIVPVTFATSRRRIFGSWDHFHLALPFGRGVFLVGRPIEIDRNLDAAGTEAARLLVETRLNEMTAEADRRAGHGASVPSADTRTFASTELGGGSTPGCSPAITGSNRVGLLAGQSKSRARLIGTTTAVRR
jgi:hypothetical protein